MDLIGESWLPGRRNDGTTGSLTPLDIIESEWCDLATTRPDFQGAAYQFLIGLLQTGFAPADRGEWHKRLLNPPSRQELEQALAPIRHVFLLRNDGGPAFLQDLQLEDGREAGMLDLLFEQGSVPGQFFSKPPREFGLCEPCTTLALATMQFNAPSGGRGTRTSVRGGGPITTLLMPRHDDASLWERLWLNVIPAEELGYPQIEALSDVFPWLAPTRRSDDGHGLITTPESVHPLQVYWSMSRRIRFDWSDAVPGQCSICGADSPRLLRKYHTRHGGVNYGGAWMHPLSPYTLDPTNEKPPIARKGQPGGIGYRDWLGLTYGSDNDHPAAKVVQGVAGSPPSGYSLRLWASGADFDNMKMRGWYDSMMPMPMVEPSARTSFIREIDLLLSAATAASGFLNTRVREAWSVEKSNPAVQQSLWEETEGSFYSAVHNLAEVTDDGDLDRVIEVRREWLRTVRKQVLELFDRWAAAGQMEVLNLAKVVTARGGLVGDLHRKKPMKDLWLSVRTLAEAGQ